MLFGFDLVLFLILLSTFAKGSTPKPEVKSYRFSTILSEDIHWNPEEDSWHQLYFKMCGVFCDGARTVKVLLSPSTKVAFCEFSCYKCDCEATCGLYGTCCPQLDPHTPLTPKDTELEYNDKWIFAGNVSTLRMKDPNDFDEYSRSNPGRAVDKRFDGWFQCIPTHFENEVWNTKDIFAIADCPDEEKDSNLRQLCESKNVTSIETIDQMVPISDLRNGVVFKNVYCLKCWMRRILPGETFTISEVGDSSTAVITNLDQSHYLKWNLTISCGVYQSLYKITDRSLLLYTVLKGIRSSDYPKSPYCGVDLTFNHTVYSDDNDILKPKPCYAHPRPKTPAPKCTGSKWTNDLTSNLCASINKPTYSVGGSYNVFCDFCNDNTVRCSHGGRNVPVGYVEEFAISAPINFLLGDQSAVIRRGHEMKTVVINETYQCPRPLEWMDESEECRLPDCADGKVLNKEEGRCKTPIPIIEGLGYKLSIVLTPERKISSSHYLDIIDSVDRFYNKAMDLGYLALYMIVFGTENSQDHDVIKYIKIQGNFIGKANVMRDEFESLFLNYKFRVSLSSAGRREETDVSLLPGGMGLDHVARMGVQDYTQGNPEDQYHLPRNVGDYEVTEIEVPKGMEVDVSRRMMMSDQPMGAQNASPDTPPRQSRDLQQPITYKNVLYVEIGKPEIYHPTWKMKSEFIDINPTLLCPFVSFDIKDTTTINETKLLITFYYNRREKTIDTSSHDRKLTIEGGKVKICIETFREVFQKITVTEQISNDTGIEMTWMSSVTRHLTIGCLILSVVCLLLTSITFCVFSQLRTLPGLNTLSLSLTLASAHVTLILVVELVGYVDGYVCIGLGIALHYTWLASFCWMGVCCVHMYLVFRGSNVRQGLGRSPAEKHSQYKVCAFGTSAVIVSVHICVCEIVSDGQTTGYSDTMCFFDTQWSILTVMISFITPLVIVLVVNTVLFGITVREMVMVRRLQAVRRVKSRDELLTYVKLSTITGVQWLVSLVAVQWSSSHVTDMCLAVLVGLQGVFIFCSFTLTRNTRALLRRAACGEGGGASSVSLMGGGGKAGSHSSNTHAQTTQATNV